MRLAAALAVLALAACGGSERRDQLAVGADRLTIPRAGWRTDFSRHAVGLDEFQRGGPGKDGIPSIDRPRFAPARATRYLRPREPVIELAVRGETRAYPLQVLVWHEIVNDRVGGVPVAVTFCPLCNTSVAFDRRLDGRTLLFGVSGLLRESDLVMFDRESETWWQQFDGRALVGRHAGTRLRRLPARIVAWNDFARRHPGGAVLQRPTGRSGHDSPLNEEPQRSPFMRPYGQNPYVGYDDVSSPPFFAAAHRGDRRLAPKERVVFVERRGDSVAVPFSVLRRRKQILVTVAGQRLRVRWRPGVVSPLDTPNVATGRDIGTADVRDQEGRLVPFDQPFWFAVAAFSPEVRIAGRRV